jgi:hypothetical protein
MLRNAYEDDCVNATNVCFPPIADIGRMSQQPSHEPQVDVARIVRLVFLPPQILASVIDGTLPTYLTVKRLTAPGAVTARWDRPNF